MGADGAAGFRPETGAAPRPGYCRRVTEPEAPTSAATPARPDSAPRLADAHDGSGRRGRRRLGPGWVPKEHGAWAMLVVPVLVGAVIAGATWRHAWLLVAWLAAFCAFSAAGLWLRSGRRARYWPPVRFHALATAVLGGALLVTTPGLLWWGPVYAPLLAVSLAASSRRADRSWLNDILTVLAACLMTVVSAGLAGGWPGSWVPPGADDPTAWLAAGLLAAFFLGTVAYVKTLIRDRGNPRVLAISVGYHAVLVVAALVWLARCLGVGDGAGVAAGLFVVAAGLLARAVLVPRRRPWPSAKAIGLGEMASTVAVTAVTLLAVA